jgi:hypothetical protein
MLWKVSNGGATGYIPTTDHCNPEFLNEENLPEAKTLSDRARVMLTVKEKDTRCTNKFTISGTLLSAKLGQLPCWMLGGRSSVQCAQSMKIALS